MAITMARLLLTKLLVLCQPKQEEPPQVPSSHLPTARLQPTQAPTTQGVLLKAIAKWRVGTRTGKVLELPDEILLNIALLIDGNRRNASLINLALTHSRFRNVAYEALITNGILPPRNLPWYIERLFKHRSSIGHVKQLRLESLPHGSSHLDRQSMGGLSREVLVECAKVISKTWTKSVPKDELQKMVADLQCHGDYPTICLCMLFTMLSNLTELYIGTSAFSLRFFRPFLSTPAGFRFRDFSPLWSDRSSSLLEAKLKVLDITSDDREELYSWGVLINVKRLDSLKFLAVPWELIKKEPPPWGMSRAAMSIWSDPGTILPSGLQCLRIYCEQRSSPWEWLWELFLKRKDFYDLRRIQLYFRRSLKNHLEDENSVLGHMGVLRNWAMTAVSFELFFLQTSQCADAEEPLYIHQDPFSSKIKTAWAKP